MSRIEPGLGRVALAFLAFLSNLGFGLFHIPRPFVEVFDLPRDGLIHVIQSKLLWKHAHQNCEGQEHAGDGSLTRIRWRKCFFMGPFVFGAQVDALQRPKNVGRGDHDNRS